MEDDVRDKLEAFKKQRDDDLEYRLFGLGLSPRWFIEYPDGSVSHIVGYVGINIGPLCGTQVYSKPHYTTRRHYFLCERCVRSLGSKRVRLQKRHRQPRKGKHPIDVLGTTILRYKWANRLND